MIICLLGVEKVLGSVLDFCICKVLSLLGKEPPVQEFHEMGKDLCASKHIKSSWSNGCWASQTNGTR